MIPALPEGHADAALGPGAGSGSSAGLGTGGTQNSANYENGGEETGIVLHSSNNIRNNANANSYNHHPHQQHHHHSPPSPSRSILPSLAYTQSPHSSSSSGVPTPDTFSATYRALAASGRESTENGL